MSTIKATDLYHTGIVVKDLEASMAQLTDLMGYSWLSPVEYPVPVWSAEGGDATVVLAMVYSIDEPRLELIREVPGTIWTAKAGNPIHHIGYFVDDFDSASKSLTDQGCPLEIAGSANGEHPSGFAYHTCLDGLRVEVVPRGVIEAMEAMSAGLDVPHL